MGKPDFSLEHELIATGAACIAGVDEVGRGPLAGPVGVAAVILDPQDVPEGLDDSKALGARRREALCEQILARARSVALVFASVEEIDALNIRGATLAAMARALKALAIAPDYALIDGRDIPLGLNCPARAIVKGDSKSASIAAASIVAKVARDSLMARLDGRWPEYGFAANAGYGAPKHLSALTRLGPTPFHRRSFNPLRGWLENAGNS